MKHHECEYCGELITGDDNNCRWCSKKTPEEIAKRIWKKLEEKNWTLEEFIELFIKEFKR